METTEYGGIIDLTEHEAESPQGLEASIEPALVEGEDEPAATVQGLRARIELLEERVRAAEALAQERADRIADLRVILRMLPPAPEAVEPPEAPSSMVWVRRQERDGVDASPGDQGQGTPRGEGEGGGSRGAPRDGIWKPEGSAQAERSEAATADGSGPPEPQREWREGDSRWVPHHRSHRSRRRRWPWGRHGD